MNLNQQYKQAVVYPFIIVMLLTIIYSVVDNHNYKSEWLTAGSVILVSIIWAFLYSLIICGLSLTIFLNKFEKIRASSSLVFLAWFLLPLSFIGIVINHEIAFRLRDEEGKFGGDFIYTLILNVPYIAGLLWSYFRFRLIPGRQHQLL